MNSAELMFTKDHIWVKSISDDLYQVGVTDYAQDLLGDIVFIELKENEIINSGDAFGVIESVKTASDLISPSDLKITKINHELMDNLTSVNDSPYESWICEIKSLSQFETISKAEYEKLVG
ncbi:MAG: glycine cleavage system protein H [Proteobacteria bacterium]|nr:glycine cleavage system protein H [Pseudomonadota bacterium]